MLRVMALMVLRIIAEDVRTSKFAVMVDETTVISTTELILIVLHWVGINLDVHEHTIGLYSADSISIENCQGQCYDGATNMWSCRTGVAIQIMDMEPRSISTTVGMPLH